MTSFIGDNLKLLRKNAGLTVREVANDLDIHHGTLSNYENGKRPINDELIEEFADYYGVSIEELEYGVML